MYKVLLQLAQKEDPNCTYLSGYKVSWPLCFRLPPRGPPNPNGLPPPNMPPNRPSNKSPGNPNSKAINR